MPFSAEKKKDHTLISFSNSDKNRYLIFIFFLTLQIIVLGVLSVYSKIFEDVFIISFGIGLFLSCVFFYLSLRKKILRLSKEGLNFESKIFGITMYKKALLWKIINQVAVEFTRLKAHDILFQVGNKTIYLGESLSEEESDALLKEIQLFHFYYLSPKTSK
ncbi:hypothetical protein JHD50_10510 [Sulfurimonas sp. MAG313]|nr:hypothetical protein [Sulfurimonas sp. MAG313]MDF1881725.1 hypothetical protein [Sulfurimonas sp. MAG313]